MADPVKFYQPDHAPNTPRDAPRDEPNMTPEPTKDYWSFLICFHPGHTDVYRNGLPLGVIREGVFQIHEHVMPDGTKAPVKIPEDLPRQVFETVALLPSAEGLGQENARLRKALERIQANDPEANRLHADEIANAALGTCTKGPTKYEP